MQSSRHSGEPGKAFTVVWKRRRRGARQAESFAGEELSGEEKYVRAEVARREDQRLLNRHFSDTSTAAFRHMDRQERWEYIQQLLRKTQIA